MTHRVSKHLVTFRSAFFLDSLEDKWPAGDYTIETEEELIDGSSFQTFRSVRTTMIIYPKPGRRNGTKFISIDPADLAAALARDQIPLTRAENEGMSAP
jgi:hypothetical protein